MSEKYYDHKLKLVSVKIITKPKLNTRFIMRALLDKTINYWLTNFVNLSMNKKVYFDKSVAKLVYQTKSFVKNKLSLTFLLK